MVHTNNIMNWIRNNNLNIKVIIEKVLLKTKYYIKCNDIDTYNAIIQYIKNNLENAIAYETTTLTAIGNKYGTYLYITL